MPQPLDPHAARGRRPRPPRITQPTIERILLAAAAGLWLAALFLPATAVGFGSIISGRELADLIGSGTTADLAPRWLGVAWYLGPLGAAAVLVAFAVDRPWGATVQRVAALVAVGGVLVFVGFVTHLRPARLGVGSWLALGGVALTLAAFVVLIRHRRSPDVTR